MTLMMYLQPIMRRLDKVFITLQPAGALGRHIKENILVADKILTFLPVAVCGCGLWMGQDGSQEHGHGCLLYGG